MFWKTSWKLVWPAPLLKFAAEIFSRLVAHAGTDDPDATLDVPPEPDTPVEETEDPG
ncbi:hypothetical protein [Actinacidiphila soli]|uniref:hypothetical protein n=1 Tax=Actinacidiphila soli TaxID=2487275 RepID=UPI001F0C8C1E|nr:hypothetical protein [Actinacidiphila soli]